MGQFRRGCFYLNDESVEDGPLKEEGSWAGTPAQAKAQASPTHVHECVGHQGAWSVAPTQGRAEGWAKEEEPNHRGLQPQD